MGQEIAAEPLADLQTLTPLKIPPGLSLQLVLKSEEDFELDGREEWIVRSFFASQRLTAEETLESFLSTGGVVLMQMASVGKDAEQVLAQLQENGRDPLPPTVSIGPHQGVLIHGDPISSDEMRPFHLYWSDLSLIGTADPVEIVNMARSLYCG